MNETRLTAAWKWLEELVLTIYIDYSIMRRNIYTSLQTVSQIQDKYIKSETLV